MRKQPLGVIVSVILLLFVTVTFSALGVWEYTGAGATLHEDLEDFGENTLDRLLYSMAEPVWDFDTQWAGEVLASEMLAKEVFAIKVFDKDGKLFAGSVRDAQWEPRPLDKDAPVAADDTRLFEGDLARGDEAIGRVELHLTEQFLNQALSSLLVEKVVTIIVADIVIILGLFLALRGIIILPLMRLQAYATSVGGGELECAYPEGTYRGELGQLHEALFKMVCNLKEYIENAKASEAEAKDSAQRAERLRGEAEAAKEQAIEARREGMLHAANTLEGIVARISSSSEELSHQVEEVNQGTDHQRERIQTTAASTQQMNTAIMEVARSAGEASQTAEDTQQHAGQGNAIVDTTVESIKDVNTRAEGLRGNMESLEQKAQDIGQVITVIEDIADQTNLLALNAAIEAARAGDAGRGFAVVADEVRKLAEKTMTATKEVSNSILGIQQETKRSLSVTEEVSSAVGAATESAVQAGQALGEILEQARSTSDQIRLIATAAEEQSASTEEITRSIEDINEIAERTSEGMQQSAEAIADLAQLAGELNTLIEEMKAG